MLSRQVETRDAEAVLFLRNQSAKILPLAHRLFDLKSNLTKKFCPFLDVDKTVNLHNKSERPCDISSAREQEKVKLASYYISIMGKKKIVWTIKRI